MSTRDSAGLPPPPPSKKRKSQDSAGLPPPPPPPDKNRQRSRLPSWRSPPFNKNPPRYCLVCRRDLLNVCPACEASLAINADSIYRCQALQCQDCGYMFHEHCIDSRTVHRIRDCPMKADTVHRFVCKKQRDGEGMEQYVVDDWQIDPSILLAEVSKINEVSKFK